MTLRHLAAFSLAMLLLPSLACGDFTLFEPELDLEIRAAFSHAGGPTRTFGTTGLPLSSKGPASSTCVYLDPGSGHGVGDCSSEPEPYTWRITGRLLERLEVDSYRFELEVRRMGSAFDEARTVLEEELVLSHGDSRLLDVFELPEEARLGQAARNLVLTLEAKRYVPAELADRGQAFELWWVHENPSGARREQRLDLAGPPGAELPFAFEALRFPVPGARLGGEAVIAELEAEGRVRSWPVDTDLREASLEARLVESVRLESKQAAGSASSAHGEKRFEISTGEAIEIELPNPRPGSTHTLRKALFGHAARSGYGPEGSAPEGLRISFAELLEDHRFSLILRAR